MRAQSRPEPTIGMIQGHARANSFSLLYHTTIVRITTTPSNTIPLNSTIDEIVNLKISQFMGTDFHFLVGAFLEKRVDYSHGFLSVFFKFFFDTPEVNKIVLPQKFYNILRRRQIVTVGPKNSTKKVSGVTYNTRGDQRAPPFSFFSAL